MYSQLYTYGVYVPLCCGNVQNVPLAKMTCMPLICLYRLSLSLSLLSTSSKTTHIAKKCNLSSLSVAGYTHCTVPSHRLRSPLALLIYSSTPHTPPPHHHFPPPLLHPSRKNMRFASLRFVEPKLKPARWTKP